MRDDEPGDATAAGPLERAEDLLAAWGMHLALVAAWVATLGSLYFSEVRHFVPCPLCWYQRILMYPIALVVPLALLRRDRHVPVYSLALAGIGLPISVYHYLLQKTTWFTESQACKAGVPCSSDYINWFGFVTIPFLAGIAFLIILFAASAARRLEDPPWAGEGPTPWRAVAGAALAGLVGFAVFVQVDRALTAAARPSSPASGPLLVPEPSVAPTAPEAWRNLGGTSSGSPGTPGDG